MPKNKSKNNSKNSKATFEIESYGIYTPLDKSTQDLPQIIEFNTKVPIGPEIEFGVIIKAHKAKGEYIDFLIKHPKWPKPEGGFVPDFEAQLPIKSSPYRLFIGDCFWEPWEDKAGEWQILAWHNGKKIIDQKFQMYLSQ